jgi:hypothetical protein
MRKPGGPIQAGQADLGGSSRIRANLIIIDCSPVHAALGTRILLSALRSVDKETVNLSLHRNSRAF